MRKNFICLTNEALERYKGKTLYDVADDYYSADKRKFLKGVYIGRKPKCEYAICIAFFEADRLQRFLIGDDFKLRIHTK